MTVCSKCKFYNICKGRLNETVENCVRFKSVEQTNEERFCSLPTEEKAKALETIIRNVLVQRPPMCHDICNREFWEKWLKEKHDGGNT